MGERFEDFLYFTQKVSDADKLLKFPRFQRNLKYNFDGLYSYNTRIALLDLPHRTIIKIGRWLVTSTTHYNNARRLLQDHYGFQEIVRDSCIDGSFATCQ